MTSYANRLKNLKDQWKNDKPAAGMAALPAGKYQFQVTRAFLEPSKASFNKGNLTLVVQLTVASGALKGRKAMYRLDLEAKANKEKNWPSGISRFKGLLDNLKLDMPSELNDEGINAVLSQLVNAIVEGQSVVNDKGYSNIYLNRLVNAGGDTTDEDESDEEDDETDDETSDDAESDDESDDEDEEDESDDDEEDAEEDEEEPPAKKPAPKAEVKPVAKPIAKPTGKPTGKPADKKDDDDWSL